MRMGDGEVSVAYEGRWLSHAVIAGTLIGQRDSCFRQDGMESGVVVAAQRTGSAYADGGHQWRSGNR